MICNVECRNAETILFFRWAVNGERRVALSRPALAASRGTHVMNFLASVPDRRFSLTEIAQATGVNRASCLAILGELTQRGYLCRHASRKIYWLGPALIAAGQAAAVANPILARARTAAERLLEDLGLPVLLSTRIGDEIVCIFSLVNESGRTAGMRAGERVPLVPPIGASFVAWAPPDQAETWISRRADAGGGAGRPAATRDACIDEGAGLPRHAAATGRGGHRVHLRAYSVGRDEYRTSTAKSPRSWRRST